ncbi:MAG: DUF4407 domain-containing protein [Dactylosporangium sp.]|nr:DUF4407 domain-containing protein [Dactylosporangium sp.]NNJ62436.1 DUF4407 domain-containing protein [Dactylosporangium sp.]
MHEGVVARVARLGRSLTGVQEDVLNTVPAERSRFTTLGAVVAGTALMSMISMVIALSCVFGSLPLAGLPFVLLWGALVLSLDRWLMSSAAGRRPRHRLGKLIPRLLLSIAIGFVVAEPVLLAIFNTAVIERVERHRTDEIIQLQSDLLICNPVPGQSAHTAVPATGCGELRLSLAGQEAEAKGAELTALSGQATGLGRQVAADAETYAALEFAARQECTGADGPGLSGHSGVGPNCVRLRDQADQFRHDHRIAENAQQLTDLTRRIQALSAEIGVSASGFAADRESRIAEEIAKARHRQGAIGLLERIRALGELVSEDRRIQVVVWALRALFVVVDALPMLVKALNGSTAYDAVVADRLHHQETAQRLIAETEAQRVRLREETRRQEIAARQSAARRVAVRRVLATTIPADESWEALTSARARYLMEESPTPQRPVPPGELFT